MYYQNLTDKELEQKIITAQSWLKDNEEHPKYSEAMRRYLELKNENRRRYMETMK